MERFRKLGLSSEILEVIKQAGFSEPTEIQEKAIPLAVAGKDIIGGSSTGSGKTLVFASSIIQNLKQTGKTQALVLTPTRELAEQVSKVFKRFSKNSKLHTTAIYGGVGMGEQIRQLQFSDIVIGTPGRILDHLGRRNLDLSHVKVLVLDEVDRMFDMGFRRDVEKIIGFCPKKRQTMLFSATISSDIDYLAKKHTQNAVEVAVKSNVDPAKLRQVYYDIFSNQKFSLLVHLLKKEASSLVMVFTNTRRMADFLEKNLKKNNIDALAIHGGLSQNKRTKILERFHGQGVKVLVCTDVAARGLDIKGVTHVYNFDIPPVSNDYIHRIGRTARAGKEGIAVSLIGSKDYDNFSRVMKIENINIERTEVPKFEQIEVKTNYGSREKHFGNRNFRRESGRSENRNFSRSRNSPRDSRVRPRQNSGRFNNSFRRARRN